MAREFSSYSELDYPISLHVLIFKLSRDKPEPVDPSSKGPPEILYENPIYLPEWTTDTVRVTAPAIAPTD